MKHIDTMLSVFQRHSCICQVIIWTPEGPISYASESLIVIFLPWYNCYAYDLNGNKMFLNWIEMQGARASAVMVLPELARNIPVSVLPERGARSQGISSDGITGVGPEYSGLSITRTWRKEPGHQQW